MKISTKKSYDCVKSIRKERDRIAKDTEGMTPKEIIEYFTKRTKKNEKGKIPDSEKRER